MVTEDIRRFMQNCTSTTNDAKLCKALLKLSEGLDFISYRGAGNVVNTLIIDQQFTATMVGHTQQPDKLFVFMTMKSAPVLAVLILRYDGEDLTVTKAMVVNKEILALLNHKFIRNQSTLFALLDQMVDRFVGANS